MAEWLGFRTVHGMDLRVESFWLYSSYLQPGSLFTKLYKLVPNMVYDWLGVRQIICLDKLQTALSPITAWLEMP